VNEPNSRLISCGGLLADLVVGVDALPARGEDVLAHGFTQTVGGGFATLAAAARLGMPTALAGVLGDDAIADAARAALRAEGVELLFPEPRAGGSGVCLVLVDSAGERTMVTVQGVESRVQSEDFDAIAPGPADVLYINGYELLYDHGTALVNWVRRIRPAHLVFDPGPLVASIDPAALAEILAATSWLSLNASEATSLTGEADAAAAASVALRRIGAHQKGGSELDGGGVVVRAGAEGCVVLARGEEPVAVPAFPAQVVDTTGAGDTHVGAFIAALARGLEPVEACRWGNAAAAVVVASRGQASPPRLGHLEAVLRRRAGR
jgi:sugar/nucleoside kinase (ribokinase family)